MRWASNGKSWIIRGLKSDILLVNVTSKWKRPLSGIMRNSRHLDCPTSSQKLNVWLFHTPTTADRAFCTGTTTSHHESIFHAVLVETPVCYAELHTLFLGLLFTASRAESTTYFFRSNQCAMFPSLSTFITHTHTHTHTSCIFKLFHNPVGGVPRWCNTNRKPSTKVYLHSNTTTTKRLKDFETLSNPSCKTPSCNIVQ
jgi:hypothetical protein